MKPLTLLGACLVAMAVSACGRDGGGQPSPSSSSGPPAKQGPFTLVIQDHRFVPAEITIPANTAVELQVINKDPLAEEFDSSALKVEKVIAGGDAGTVRLHPLDPGRYPFVGEYHAETAKGVVVAK